jgi:hypothetical protein
MSPATDSDRARKFPPQTSSQRQAAQRPWTWGCLFFNFAMSALDVSIHISLKGRCRMLPKEIFRQNWSA